MTDVGDQPWGPTLGALGRRSFTGRVEIGDDGYAIEFDSGAVISASSPLPADSTIVIAVANRLVAATQVAEIDRKLAAMPDHDAVEVIASAVNLSPDKAERLRRRVIAQRTARTFSIEQGELVIREGVPAVVTCSLDIRPIIYLGTLINLSDERLTQDLSRLGERFQLRREAHNDLPHYGFLEAEHQVAVTLQRGATIDELVAAHRDLDQRTIMAIVYTLVSGHACECDMPVISRTSSRIGLGAEIGDAAPTDSLVEEALAVFARLEAEQLEQPADGGTPVPAMPRTRTDQLISFVAIPRTPAITALPTPSPLADRPRTPTPVGHLIEPRRPSKP